MVRLGDAIKVKLLSTVKPVDVYLDGERLAKPKHTTGGFEPRVSEWTSEYPTLLDCEVIKFVRGNRELWLSSEKRLDKE